MNRKTKLQKEIEELNRKNSKWTKECGNAEPTPYENKLLEIQTRLSELQLAKQREDLFIKKLKEGIQKVRNHHDESVLKEYNVNFVQQFIDKLQKEILEEAKK